MGKHDSVLEQFGFRTDFQNKLCSRIEVRPKKAVAKQDYSTGQICRRANLVES